MDTLNILLDNARERCSPSTDAALAVKLGVSKSAVSLWRKGGQITEKHLTALIDFAQVDAKMAVTVLAEQATTKPERAVWGALARQLGTAAVLALAAVLPFQSKASAVKLNHFTPYALCEMNRRGRLARALRSVVTFVTERLCGPSPLLA